MDVGFGSLIFIMKTNNPDEIIPPGNLTAQVSEKRCHLKHGKDNSINENGFTIQRNDGAGYNRIDYVSSGIQTYTDEKM